ncbi:MAG TPA: elongation factor 1-beta [Methanoregulaceae archaeon]|mgnify:CR=1 FL=1|jgi:elongation factor 1-beta|nr:elongation factor 1-beta [Methanoregulaceae archaeon]HOV67872.1 elongation factor 1-beta [Methanoregulaceae archaeon]HQJ87421.1 elongation factor 1-beta [Methanoregulaceae archaeon]
MGDVACIIRVMPESPEVDLEGLKRAMKEKVPEIHEIREEPIGFGLKALMVVAVVGDTGGQTDRLEEDLSSLPGVERAEIVEVTLT